MIAQRRPKDHHHLLKAGYGKKWQVAIPSPLMICLLLTGCSSVWVDADAPIPDPKPVQAPSQTAVQKGVGVLVKDAKLKQPVEVSALRKSDRGPGPYYVCLREVSAPADRPRYIFSVFFDNEDYKGSRQSVIMDDCEQQMYNPIQIAATDPG
ncbi:hypothetical protein ML401_23310 [Bradyrhizobium sp. 62B]|uniref:hypothetical protein n=1 Tax=Bradyrhizobium sp. 62B TaxID=2898442 RepID=UPI002557EDF7|nr:hypothetical protein ML401_23310 [Bradyrhizobium sp. 62B]